MSVAGRGEILRRFGAGETERIGAGAQSEVFALPGGNVLRLLRAPVDPAILAAQAAFLVRIDGRLPFATPLVREIDSGGRFTVERRLPGRALADILPRLRGADREKALRNYALAAEAVGAVVLADLPYGQVIGPAAIVAPDWRRYLAATLDRFCGSNGPAIEAALGGVAGLRDAVLALLADVPAHPRKSLVHGDYFPGNVLLDEGLAVSALLDFSVWTVAGDPVLDRAGAAIFLEMSSEATADDVAFVRALVLPRLTPAQLAAARFYRAYAAFAIADPGNAGGRYPKLFPWALENLQALREGRLEA